MFKVFERGRFVDLFVQQLGILGLIKQDQSTYENLFRQKFDKIFIDDWWVNTF